MLARNGLNMNLEDPLRNIISGSSENNEFENAVIDTCKDIF